MPPEKWEIPPPDAKAGQGVLDCFNVFLQLNNPDNMRNKEYSFHQFAQLCGRSNSDDDTVNFAKYLISLGVLKVYYLFCDDKGKLSEKYSAKDILEAKRLGSLVHPQTGKEITDFANRIFPFLVLCRQNASAEH